METTPKSAFVEVFEPALLEGIVASYDGEVTESGCFVGMGSAVLDSGVTYEGTFVNGTMHGDGKMVWPDGTVYQGMFAEGLVSNKSLAAPDRRPEIAAPTPIRCKAQQPPPPLN